ncbi:MAG: S9 family peptidase [Candidatus Zixiibacteriota bacterium]|nr:MAG: S9 family peptidase [candidate division Zixibacteria bacterium]
MKSKFTVQILVAVLLISAAGCTSQQEAGVADATKVASLLDKGAYQPDIAAFMQIGGNFLSGASWDGSKVFFESRASGAYQIYRITEEGWPYQLTAFEDGVDFFSLSRNGQLAIIGASVGGSEQSQLYLMDVETGRLVQLTDYEDTRFGQVVWAQDDKSIFYYSNEENRQDMFVYRMDIATGESEKIFGDTAGVRGWCSAVDVSQDGNLLLLDSWTSNTSCDIYLMDLSTGEFQKLNDDEGNVEYVSLTLMPDNKTIWLRCNGNEDGTMRLAKMTVGSPEVEYIDDGWLDTRWELAALGVSSDYRFIAALINEDGYQRLKIREIAGGKELPAPPLDGVVSSFEFDRKGCVVLQFDGPTRAADLWKWDPRSEKLEQLTFATYAGIDRTTFRDPELIHYTSFDGLEIPAFLYLPPDYKEGEAVPFLVHAHGGPESQYKPQFQRNIQYFLLNGFGVLAPNPRGSSGYGREYRDLDNYKNRQNSLKDYKAGVEWLLENGYTAPGMLGIKGGSYGGYVVLGMITEYPEMFSAAADIVGIANFKTFLENTKPYRRHYRETEYGPLSDPEFLESVSPIHKAGIIETPLLVIHGENDPRVPVGEARQIIAAINQRGGEVDSLIFPDEGHGAKKTVNIIAMYRLQAEFFSKYLSEGN